MAYDRTRDRMQGMFQSRTQTARRAIAITGSALDLTTYCAELYIATAGTVTVIPIDSDDDTTVTFTTHPVGYLRLQCRRVTVCPAGTIALYH